MDKIIILFMLILLAGCSHMMRKKDGPPNFYVDESKVHDAVPKSEPLSKFGNMPSYRVFGKRYYTLRSSRNYDKVGIASWYGTQFHAHNTSSGEPYNMLAMTAAHKTLPLPTYVEVTNLRNHRKVIVKVNDRGPFESNRIIDLSYVAAKKLGMIGHGTAKVRVKAINPYTFGKKIQCATQSAHIKKSSQRIYYQVGAFREKSNAVKLKDRLSNLLTAPVAVFSRGRLYRVQVGPITDLATEDRIASRLKDLGIKSNKM